jgi:hypothetical protein
MMVHIQFKDLNVEVIHQSSGVFSGENIHLGMKSSSKQNEGNGRVIGNKNVSWKNEHIIVDTDFADVFFPRKKKS